MKFQPSKIASALFAVGVLSLSAVPTAQAVTLEELAKKLEAMEKQNAELSAKVKQLEADQGKQAVQVQQQSKAIEQQAVASSASGSSLNNWASKTTVTSYGEIGYSRPTKAPENAQVDVGRAVIGITHRFDEKTKMVSEFEWEHAITSATDKGEAEVEQLYVEHELNNGLRAKAGLFLMPVGLINANHEPTAYYGVFRNSVETAIIPSTWREVGLGLSGTTESALSWDVGITTGFDLTKWDPKSTDGSDSPLRAVHGEGQFAKARNLSAHAALNWRGVPGLLLGGSVFTGKVGHNTAGFAGNDTSLVLFDVHARYQIDRLDLSAMYTTAKLSNTDALNIGFASSTTPNPVLVPSKFGGGYVQAAYKLWQTDQYSLTPFVRYERFNTAKAYGAIPLAAGAIVKPDEKIWTLGTSFKIGEGVVLKTDYQKFQEDNTKDRLNLGVGYSF
ncbi:hypothetical protein H8K47_17165 [Undibacterium sp. CY7W]|uniref:Porin n=2 Tax=Undibacterium rugosum TaxID=2762291 RepID=A0A923I6K1_9BURK|nr:hypothetical protein [Undibacterium rugosum]